MSDPAIDKPAGDLMAGHTVRRYDQELAKLRAIILQMGERVIDQTQAAVAALIEGDESQTYRVLDREPLIDYLSLDADEEVFRVIARRQPTAVDLRIVLALSKIAGEVERAGDKAVRIAREALELRQQEQDGELLVEPLRAAFQALDDRACCMFERSVHAVTGFDVNQALTIFENEPALYAAAHDLRQLLGESDSDGLVPRQAIALFHCAQALKRIGNHASNIAEQVIYVALGQDVRYRNREILIETLRHRGY
ncbi:phosphate signaling complex protein PhoU [Allochromatium vinosum]|uniref:Phosphate uptake regulator, PhoU n=1 Tax=Allochromatium vinosum (strain ATCC 17899 / DSM 180 / NBRC 103801 / NCIMB 10441 / D) TaxID=572477 RepID=D3RN57_ALLVD|nr:phosphate signaling complex protein PhoU [Allochromatium vinosum]ADC61341.1 phosphate uptake regulator, PhoU [Allochromatium vinosum DSM 180]